MLRKFVIAAAAVASLSVAALAPTAASAGWKGHHHHHGHFKHHWGPSLSFYAPTYAYGGGCYVKRWVPTSHGMRLRWVNRCY